MDIQVLSRKAEGAERRLQISVSAERVASARERATRRVAQQVRLPGFRPGKAPTAVVRKKFADAIQQEALEALMREAYDSVLQTEKIEPVTQPHAHDVKFDEGQALTFELHCEVKPALELARLGGFRVTRPNPKISEEMVSEQVERLRDQRATWAPVDEKPREGDMVALMLATQSEDGTVPEAKEYRIVLGAGQAIGAIEEVITELAPGVSVTRSVKWPDDFPDEAERGKHRTVSITLNEVKRKSLPSLDDTLARELGDFESLDALQKAVRDDLIAAAERESDAAVRGSLMDEILAANAFDVPPSWVRSLVGAYAKAYQVPEQEREKFAGEFQAMAERQVRRDLVIDDVAGREKLTATEKDVDDRVSEMAAHRGAEPGQVYAALQKANRLREIERGITEDRVFAFLLAKSTVEQA